MLRKLNHFIRDLNQWSLFIVIIGFFIAIPIFAIIGHLFDGVGEMWQHILEYFLFTYISNSLILLLGTGILTFLIGVSSAWIVSKYEFPFRKLIEWLLYLPLAIPSYIVAYAYVGVLGNGGTLIRFFQSLGIPIQKIEMMNIYGLIWVLSLSLFPYVYAGTRVMFASFPNTVRESAYLLGANEKKYFFKVALPLVSPAIIGGIFLVFMEVLNDYGAAKYYGINTFTTGIFRTWTALEDLQSAIYLSAILILIVFFFIALSKWQRGKKSYSLKLDNNKQKSRITLKGKKKFFYLNILLLIIFFGFLLPLFQLLYWSFFTFSKMFNMELFNIAMQSFGVAFSAASLIVLSALVLVYLSKWNKIKLFSYFSKVAVIGYVIPGAIIGIGIIRSSQSIINFFSNNFNLNVGYLFYGSSIILIYAYVFRFLAVAYNPIEANTLKLGKDLSESSYLLGLNKIKTLIKVDFPILKHTLTSAFLLVFIDILKELPLTLILKPYNLKTLAVTAFEYADDEMVSYAAIPSLLLILIITLLMIIINHLNKTSKFN